MLKINLLTLTLLNLVQLPAVHGQSILDGYIKKGLQSNLALRQKGFDLQKAQLDLKRAAALFFPQAGFASDYTLAEGGRSQDIPVGDLLNNVYSTLNSLTGTNKFPQVANQSIKFLPNDYQDTRVEISLPLVNTDIRYNKQIKQELVGVTRADMDVYKRELVRQIRQAYYQYLQAGKAVEIYDNAIGLVRENERTSAKLVQNGMGTREIMARARAQASQVETSLIGAKNKLRSATAYFNFLLNRPLDVPVIVDSSLFDHPDIALPGGTSPAGREELAKLRSAGKALDANLKLNRSYWVPRLNAFYNIGFQGFGFHFNGDQFYQLGGLQLRWSLFKAGDNKYRIRQSEIDAEAIRDQYQDLEQLFTLQVQTATDDERSALEALKSSSDEVESAAETYRLTEKRFREGQALQIELIDARTQWTGAGIRYSLARLAVLSKAADLERVTASYKF